VNRHLVELEWDCYLAAREGGPEALDALTALLADMDTVRQRIDVMHQRAQVGRAPHPMTAPLSRGPVADWIAWDDPPSEPVSEEDQRTAREWFQGLDWRSTGIKVWSDWTEER